MDYSKQLFNNYHDTHSLQSGINEDDSVKWFKDYYKHYYKHIFDQIPTSAKILEIGCNNGAFLRCLCDLGFNNLYGIDLSPGDLNVAKEKLPNFVKLECVDAFEYLQNMGGGRCDFFKSCF